MAFAKRVRGLSQPTFVTYLGGGFLSGQVFAGAPAGITTGDGWPT